MSDQRSGLWTRNVAHKVGQPTAADFYVPSLPGLPNLSSHPTYVTVPSHSEATLTGRHPLNLYAGHLDSYPGDGQGGGEGDTGKDAAILYVPSHRPQLPY